MMLTCNHYGGKAAQTGIHHVRKAAANRITDGEGTRDNDCRQHDACGKPE
jgi:hypothetical protein